MDKFLEFFRALFGLSDEQLEKAQEELNKVEKIDEKPEKEDKEDKEDNGTKADATKADATKDTAKGVSTQPAGVNDKDKGDAEMVSAEEYKKVQKELAAVKAILEKQNADAIAEKRMNKITGYKDCLDTSYLASLLEGVEVQDFDKKVEEIKKEKAYLFSKPETEGFNPAEPSTKMNGVEAAFYRNNPDLRPSQV